jgi:hypothetical protein
VTARAAAIVERAALGRGRATGGSPSPFGPMIASQVSMSDAVATEAANRSRGPAGPAGLAGDEVRCQGVSSCGRDGRVAR